MVYREKIENYFDVKSIKSRNIKNIAVAIASIFAIHAADGCFHTVHADNFSSAGQRWSGSWSIPSFNERAVLLQQAQLIKQAEQAAAPTTVINNLTDNRSGYIETNAIDGSTISGASHIGEEIGQNTNSIGAMNTGNTSIDINGSGNSVNAVNSADSKGCVDGSIATGTTDVPAGTSTSGIDISISGTSVGKAGCN